TSQTRYFKPPRRKTSTCAAVSFIGLHLTWPDIGGVKRRRSVRARAARNHFRHSLSLPVPSDPTWSEEVQALTRESARRAEDPMIAIIGATNTIISIGSNCVSACSLCERSD